MVNNVTSSESIDRFEFISELEQLNLELEQRNAELERRLEDANKEIEKLRAENSILENVFLIIRNWAQ